MVSPIIDNLLAIFEMGLEFMFLTAIVFLMDLE